MSAMTRGLGAGIVLGLAFVLLAQQFGVLLMLTVTAAATDLVIGIVVGGLLGAAIGWALGRGGRRESGVKPWAPPKGGAPKDAPAE